MKTRYMEYGLASKSQKPALCVVLATIILSCGHLTPERLIPIVDVEEIRNGGFQHSGDLLIRMSQSEWEEANVEVVEGLPLTDTSASLIIFEIPAPPNGESVWFFKPDCPPCYDVVFTYYGWQCRATSRCPPPEADLRCTQVRFLEYRLACFGSCRNGGTCEYRAFRPNPLAASFLKQGYASFLTAIASEMEVSGKKIFDSARVIAFYCGCA